MTNKKPKHVAVFDVDGTLIDAKPKLIGDVKGAFKRLGFEVSTSQIDRNNWYDLAASYKLSKDEFDKEFDKRKSWEQSLNDGEVPLFEDTIPCLEELSSRGVVLATLSRSNLDYTLKKLSFHGLDRYFGDRISITPVTEKDKLLQAKDLVERIGMNNLFYFVGDKFEDISVSRYFPSSKGVFVHRPGQEIPREVFDGQYNIIDNLTKLPKMIY